MVPLLVFAPTFAMVNTAVNVGGEPVMPSYKTALVHSEELSTTAGLASVPKDLPSVSA